MFTDGFDPDPRSRPVVTFHRPETFARWLRQWRDDADGGSLRARLERLGPVPPDGLRRIQVEAINRVEASMVRNHPRALAQMATGSGKTFMAANLAYRLVQLRRCRAGAVPRRPGQPRPPDVARVPAVRHAGRWPQVHRPLQRAAPHLEPDRPGGARRDHDGAAAVLDAARRGRSSPRTSTRSRAPRSNPNGRSRSPTTRRSRSRRSTWSSSTSATARSTACGGR